jgi:hypothetical protein
MVDGKPVPIPAWAIVTIQSSELKALIKIRCPDGGGRFTPFLFGISHHISYYHYNSLQQRALDRQLLWSGRHGAHKNTHVRSVKCVRKGFGISQRLQEMP